MSLTAHLHPRRLSLLAAGAAAGLIALLVVCVAPLAGTAAAQDGTPISTITETPAPTATQTPAPTALPTETPTQVAPTLVPPTPLPTLTATPFTPPTESGLAAIQRDRVLRVGTYFNAYPFAWLNEQGAVTGYEVEILEAIAIELGSSELSGDAAQRARYAAQRPGRCAHRPANSHPRPRVWTSRIRTTPMPSAWSLTGAPYAHLARLDPGSPSPSRLAPAASVPCASGASAAAWASTCAVLHRARRSTR